MLTSQSFCALQLRGGFIACAGLSPLQRSVTAPAEEPLHALPTQPDVRPGVGPPEVALQLKHEPPFEPEGTSGSTWYLREWATTCGDPGTKSGPVSTRSG